MRLIQSINEELGEEGHNPQLITGSFNSQWGKLRKQLDKLVEASAPVVAYVTETEPAVEEQLSSEARQLLLEASKDDNGMIIYIRNLGEKSLSTNGMNITSDNSARAVAIWKSALEDLIDFNLIADTGYQGEVFAVTREGYRVADLIEARNS